MVCFLWLKCLTDHVQRAQRYSTHSTIGEFISARTRTCSVACIRQALEYSQPTRPINIQTLRGHKHPYMYRNTLILIVQVPLLVHVHILLPPILLLASGSVRPVIETDAFDLFDNVRETLRDSCFNCAAYSPTSQHSLNRSPGYTLVRIACAGMAGQLRSFLLATARRRSHPWKEPPFADDARVAGFSRRAGGVFVGGARGFSSFNQGSKSGVGVRKRMVPLIKLVHPDLFAQYPPDVASTNSKSLQVRVEGCVCA